MKGTVRFAYYSVGVIKKSVLNLLIWNFLRMEMGLLLIFLIIGKRCEVQGGVVRVQGDEFRHMTKVLRLSTNDRYVFFLFFFNLYFIIDMHFYFTDDIHCYLE